MTPAELLTDAFGRIVEEAATSSTGSTTTSRPWRPGRTPTRSRWLVWHLARIQDDHVADGAGARAGVDGAGLPRPLRLPFEPATPATGTPAPRWAGPGRAGLLAEYLSAVHEQTIAYLAKVTPRTSTGSSTPVGPAGDAGGPAGRV